MGVDLRLLRNFGICAHIDAGKTTTTERVLFYTGKHKAGNVDDGNTTTDFDEEEGQRGITIYSAAVTCKWAVDDTEYTINIIDTPGHVDFTAEVERSMRVLDGAIAVFDAKEGVEAQSETVWNQATRYNVPRMCFINKMDKLGADFYYSLESIRKRLGANAQPLQLPIGMGSEFRGIVDLLEMKAYEFDLEDMGKSRTNWKEIPIPEDLQGPAEEYRHNLVEAVVETDDAVMEKYLEDHDSVTIEDLHQCIRNATIAAKIYPVLMGSAKMFIGVQRVLDAACRYLPAPADLPAVKGFNAKHLDEVVTLPHSPEAPLAALVFKIVSDKHGDLAYTRVYSGTLRQGTRVLNSTRGKKENPSRVFQMQGADRVPLDEVEAGNICAIIGLKDSITGDTLCDPDTPVLLESIKFSEPVISQAIEPKSGGDKGKLGDVLGSLMRMDPTFKAWTDHETGQTMIAGMGELHLEIMVNRIKRDYKLEVEVGRPKVSYRETIQGNSEAEGKHVKQTGGGGQFGVVQMRMEPLDMHVIEDLREAAEDPKSKEGKDAARKLKNMSIKDEIAVEFDIYGGSIDGKFFGAIEKGIRNAANTGPLAGFQSLGIKCTIFDGKMHEVDSNDVAFESAGRLAFQECFRKASPVLLEPIMKVIVTAPDEFFGSISGDLNGRRAVITESEIRGATRVIFAEVPLSEMFGYSTVIRSLTQGRGQFSMEPLKYEPVPGHVQQEVVAGVTK